MDFIFRHLKIACYVTIALIFGAIVLCVYENTAPKNFPTNVFVHVEKNTSLSHIARDLKDNNVIRSAVLFRAFVTILGGEHSISQGDYFFRERLSSLRVARRVTQADFGLTPIKITFPEGTTVKDMARILTLQLPNFNTPLFVKLTQGKEGYLFPDTYFFYPNVTPVEVVETMEHNFAEKLRPLETDIEKLDKPLKDIIIMASIVEEEGKSPESRRLIAGILWKRLKDGMLLQVDAPFSYIIGKSSSDLNLQDLKIDSPYNTYLHKGLPLGPISNPGIDSIRATIMPVYSPYYYFLSDAKGEMHYATTLTEHVANKKKYLK